VNLPAAELGASAVEILMRRMTDGGASEVVLIPPALTVRGSTATANSAASADQGWRSA
jgi:DNA-binding LacI/PurR family transcriptional regulator